MPHSPNLPFAAVPAIGPDGMPPRARLALGLLVSAALHVLWLGLTHPPAVPRGAPAAPALAPLTLTLSRPAPRRERPAVAGLPASAPAPAPRVRQPERAAQPAPVRRRHPERIAEPERPSPSPSPSPSPEATPSTSAEAPPAPAPAPDVAPARPGAADILAAARQDATTIARELNHAPGSKTAFRSRAQEELDRRFDAAHAAGGSWFRSARVEEITTAADGNRRVYRIVTPLGAFCRTYYGDGSRPMNTTCPR